MLFEGAIMPNKSIVLLQEGLKEIDQLAAEAKRKNPVLYERASYTALDVILLEAEDDKENFLDRTTSAIEKVKSAATAGVKELTELQSALSAAGMENSEEAVSKAKVALEKAIPGQSFMGNLKALSSGAFSALFGEEDDPVEKVTEIVADAARYQQMLSNIMRLITDMLADIKPETAVENAEEEQGQELDPEAEKKWIEEFKAKIMSSTINEILLSPDDPYPEIRDAFPQFNEAAIKKAIKSSAKPAKWFSGLKKVSGALGIGLGGDLPFKQFGLKVEGLMEDVGSVKISDFQKVASSITPDSQDKKIVQDTTAAAGELGDLKQQAPQIQSSQEETPEQSPGSPTQQPSEEPSPSVEDPKAASYLNIVKSVAGVRDPEAAAEKLGQLLAAGFTYLPSAGLRNLLSEKVLRYDDVVASLSDHLPEDDIPLAVKQLSDEMKIELGADFDIVGVPDNTASELADLRSEIKALRRIIEDLPEEDRDSALDTIADNLEDEGVSADVIGDMLDTTIPIDDVVNDIPEDEIEEIEGAIPDEPGELATDTTPPGAPAIGEFYSYEITTGPNKGKKIGVKVAELTNNGESVSLFRPNKKGTKFTAQRFGVKITALGEKMDNEVDALKLAKAAGDVEEISPTEEPASQAESVRFSEKDKLTNIAVARMRGYILAETNNFRYTSNLSSNQVVKKFYSLGGKNRDILNETNRTMTDKRWRLIAGLKK